VQFSTEKLHVDNNVKRMVGMIKELVKVTGDRQCSEFVW